MALNKQYCVYGIDTGCFYFDEEIAIEQELYQLREQKKRYKNVLADEADGLIRWSIEERVSYLNKRIKGTKERLIDMLNVNKKKVRSLIPQKLTDKKRISLFDGVLTRCFDLVPINHNIKMTTENTVVNEEVMVVSVFYFEVLESLIKNGYVYNGYRYTYFASSAGQIRQKKAVFVREDLLNQHWNTLTCGLTVDEVNAKGGMNLNKYNAYLALCSSATDLWEDFDIDRCIVVDDFETNVIGEVDYINDIDYSITRQTMPVPIPHMDGAGIISTELWQKSAMVRLPWVKGLLSPFDFKGFVKEKGCSSVVKDIWGREWDIFKDNIQVIFTKSQLKMYAYYDSWQEYKDNFKKFNCQAGICNAERDRFKKAKINYQMTSSFIKYTDDELIEMCEDSVDFINGIRKDKDKQLELFGIRDDKSYDSYNSFQKCLYEYNGLLRDSYCREQIKALRDKQIKNLYASKFRVNGYYTFIIPDLYAFCEWLFQHIEVPKGLLGERQIHCKLHKFDKEVDCLRSPHLYQEHSIQTNTTNDEIDRWFITNGCYTSTHDLITKVIMCDVDGDTTLIIQDENVINVAKRNQEDIVPLYYNMHKAGKEAITPESRFNGLSNAFTGGNIGAISNNISKIKNSPEVVSPETHSEAMNCLRWECMVNNEVIDYAKTLYKSKPPKEVSDIIKKYVGRKLPHFFKYAKDKRDDQVEPLTSCFVDRIYQVYPKANFKTEFTDKERFDYRRLMSNFDIEVDENVLRAYSDTVSNIKLKQNKEDKDNAILISDIMGKMSSLGYPQSRVCDMLIKDMFKEHRVFKDNRCKEFLFRVYGDIILDNIIYNKERSCIDCDRLFDRKRSSQVRCPKCQVKKIRAYDRERKRKGA